MTDTALDPEEGAEDYPFCEAVVPGPAPHSYGGVADIIGMSGTYALCSQCGDLFLIDGTAPSGGGNPLGFLFPHSGGNASPSAAPATSPAPPSPSTGVKPPWQP